jgi:O-antigen/teichoic acid export membrane protein
MNQYKNSYIFSPKIKLFLKQLLYSSSLKAKTARGSIWLGFGMTIEHGTRFFRNMILTRILVPEAFGLMAIVLAITSVFESFTQVGIGQSIIQNPDSESKTYLNGAWWFSFLRGLCIFIISFIFAPYIANFYHNSQLTVLFRISCISMFFNGLISGNLFIAQKNMDFKKWVIINQGGSLIGIIATVFLALNLKNVWSLVFGFTLESIARCLLSYIFCPFLPGIKFSRIHLSNLFRYSRGMFGLPILTLIFLQGDIFIIGKILPISDLGLYSMAVNLARAPFNAINNLASQLLSPVFSKFQKNFIKINHLISFFTKIVLFLCVPIVIICIIYSREILAFVYGESYKNVFIPFSIILISEIIKITGLPFVLFYFMSGRPEMHRLFTGLRAILLIGLIYFAIKMFALNGASIVVLISIFISFIFQIIQVNTITSIYNKNYYLIFLKTLFYSIPALFIYLTTNLIFEINSMVTITANIIGCLISLSLGLKVILKEVSKV